MLCSLNVSLAVKYLVYARGGTVQTVYASVHIMVLGSRFSIQYGKIFFFSSRSGGIIDFNMLYLWGKKKKKKVQFALTKFWKITKRT